eukprot:TRINITY_DN2045_c0_g1_i9.p1 TRINITY_DN2045_c0_g1~~TRINITY_DN2045_c0_g1_i9.p1  ORF type:complete len:360 (+),score=102.94 TRINITY_DN2045_c0_g1_i9:3-1082(+)
MRIEEIPERTSAIAELNAMQAAMRLMLANLKEYKSYMPQHLVADVCSDDDTEPSTNASSVASCASSVVSMSRSLGSGSGSQGDKSSERRVPQRQSIITSNIFALQLSTRKVSIAALNIVGFTGLARSKDDKEVLGIHGSLALWLTNEVSALRGIVDTFSGDRFFVTFNASKMLMSHRPAAGRLGCTFPSECKEMGLTASAGLASGEAKVGNMGCATMRKFSFVSSLVPFVYALERHAADMGLTTLVDPLVQQECQRDILFRRAGLLKLRKFKDTPVPVFEALKMIEGGESDEWMYELEAAEKQNPYKEWDALMEAVMRADWESACGLLNAATGEGRLAEAVRAAVSQYEYEVPDSSRYH